MDMLCFLLDLRTLPPSLLRDLKQSLLQLANLYAVFPPRRGREWELSDEAACHLPDRIGLCYIHRSRSLLSDELKIAYSPKGKFSLRDFHNSVNNLPMDCFLHDPSDSDITEKLYQDICLAKLMSDENIYSWGGKDILKKVIFVGSSLITSSEGLRKTLMDAAEHCISVEFMVLELEQDQYHGFSENLEQFLQSISDLENCTLRTYVPNSYVFCGLVKRWHQDLKNDVGESLLAIFHFKESIFGSTNQILCNLSASYNHILDCFEYCKACRCHGHPLRNTAGKKGNIAFCPVVNCELGASELIENVVKVGEQTVLFMPSFQSFPDLLRLTNPINFNVIERTNLATLDEGVIVGPSYIVTLAPTYEIEAISDDFGRTELNVQLFHGLSRALSLLDQGLVCSSICDTGKMKDVEFQCFYVLQPSDRGTLLLRMLAASEEIWPIPETVSLNDITLSKEVEESIQASLSKVELKDYNPVLHERGFHQKVNLLVKESLQFGSIPVERVARSPELRTSVETDVLLLEKSSMTEISQEEIQPISKREQQIPVTQDWEELIFISDAKKNCTPLCIAKSKFDELNLSSHSKPMDEKTSRILERLEGPKLKASKQAMGTLPFSTGSTLDESIKKPLDTATVSPKISQPLKPSFQRLKRKQR